MKKIFIFLIGFLFAMAGSVFADDYTLEWDANTESDLAGYKVYYKIDGPGPPYEGTGALEGPSPIDVGNVTTITLHGLPGKNDLAPGQKIRFVCTAYNTLGWESGYSNEPSVGVPTNPGNLRLMAVSSP